MGSQFVDLNEDGHVDYLSATFDGSPHVAYGSAEGFGEPEHLLDRDGKRILISYWWNYDARKHEVTGRSMGTDEPREERCISALAYDWDADGDYDLLLGSYENGRLYRQMNEGSNQEPQFTGQNIQVKAGDGDFHLPAKMTAPQLIDWDGDGDLDIVTGTFGDSYGNGPGGGVYLSLNEGEKGQPKFGAIQQLIEPSKKDGHGPTRPDAGLYPHAVDYDGDGDLDLVVGGYAQWMPESRPLTEAEQQKLRQLKSEQKDALAKMTAINQKVTSKVDELSKGAERGSEAWRDAYQAASREFSAERSKASQAYTKLRQQISELEPTKQRQSFVWLYERQ